MPAITLIITNAGRAALVDAATAGTFAVRIASAGLTASAFTPLATATTLPGEFARITGISGAAIDPDTITLNVRDDSSAVYTLRGLGLFLTDGTLFAIYSQAGAILEKSANSTALIVLDVRFADIAATSLTFGDANFLSPPATTTVQGVIELATDAEAITGADATRAIVPSALKAVLDSRFGAGAASAFVKTLLTAATAAAFRTLLAIKSAALKDEGAGNGLDADLLDAEHGAWYADIPARLGFTPINRAGGNFTGRVGLYGTVTGASAMANATLGLGEAEVQGSSGGAAMLAFHRPGSFYTYFGLDTDNRVKIGGGSHGNNAWAIWHSGNDGSGSGADADLLDGQEGSYYTNITARLGYTPWHPGNDGAGSGLDADLLDGQDGGFYTNISARLGFTPANRGGDTFTGRVKFAAGATGSSSMANANNDLGEAQVDASAGGAAMVAFHRPGVFFTYFGLDTDNRWKVGGGSAGANAWVLWHAGNDGAGSGLDADLLDGRDASSFASASHTHGAADIAGAWAGGESGANGWMRHPNGIIEAWGQFRDYVSGEVTRTVSFDGVPFTAEPWNVQLTGYNPGASNIRDIIGQVVSRDTSGFTVFMQKPTDSSAQIDGFDWRVLGR